MMTQSISCQIGMIGPFELHNVRHVLSRGQFALLEMIADVERPVTEVRNDILRSLDSCISRAIRPNDAAAGCIFRRDIAYHRSG